jgi:DNA-binding GntR family transcriptional regulator
MAKKQSSVDRAYARLREMAVNFEFKPEERLNESALSVKLGASRTPLREALNRLVAEGLLTFDNGRGFFCRSLNPARIQELYEARSAIETEALIRTMERADTREVAAFQEWFSGVADTDISCKDVSELLVLDEEFHMRLAELSGNGELLRMLENINVRIRYVRMINLKQLGDSRAENPARKARLSAHGKIFEAVLRGDKDAAVTALRHHIERRKGQTAEAVRLAYAQLYVPSY